MVNMNLFVEMIKFALRGMPTYSLVSSINNSQLYNLLCIFWLFSFFVQLGSLYPRNSIN